MSVINLNRPNRAPGRNLKDVLGPLTETRSMYAIAFDLDTIALEQKYASANWRNAYDDIARELRLHGFERQQGSVYFGRRGMTPVNCVLAAQALAKKYKWFSKVVSDIRMLRIEEDNDLMPAIGQLDLPLGSAADG